VVGCVLTVSGVLLAGRALAPSPGRSVAGSRPSAKVAAAPSPGPTDDMLARARAIVAPAAPPTRLLIPSIGVNTKVESVGLDAQGRMGTPSVPANVAWYSSSVAPGDAGDALIDGHLNWTSGPAVFWRLGQLRIGDTLTVVRADGTRVRFVVDSTSVVPYTASEDALFTATGPPSISLITCAGTWDQQHSTYAQRLLVHASLAPGNPIESPVAGGS
jgi:sortase (surface protein transpeptidase)